MTTRLHDRRPDSGRSHEDGDPGPTRGPGSAEDGLGFLLGSTHRALRSAWEEQLADLGLSAPQALVLRLVAEDSGLGLRELARRMRTDAMNAKRLVDNLESGGHLRSVEDPAHRQRRRLRVTDEGRQVASQVARRARAWEERLAEHLDERLDKRLAARLDEHEHHAGGALAHLHSLLGELRSALSDGSDPSAVTTDEIDATLPGAHGPEDPTAPDTKEEPR